MDELKYMTLKEASQLSFRRLVDKYNYAVLEIEQLRRQLQEAHDESELPWSETSTDSNH